MLLSMVADARASIAVLLSLVVRIRETLLMLNT